MEDARTLIDTELHEIRLRFRALLLANPNYFGTAPGTGLAAVLPPTNTAYEELTCVGYQPETGRLEGVVSVKQHAGYGGGLCGPGSTEWVRFYVSFDDGVTWLDQGVSSFTVHDEAGPRPLSYDVTRYVALAERLCLWPVLPRLRAILSWNVMPTAGDPTFTPAWGNVLEARIQVRAARLIPLGTLLEEAKVAVPPALLGEVDATQPIAAAPVTTLSAADLAHHYRDSAVPAHRFLKAHLTSLMESPEANPGTALAALGIDVAAVLEALLATDGDTSFEALTCIGLNTVPTQEALVGVIEVRKSAGYSGGLCTSGSLEYVGFWMDFGSGWTFMGTAKVTVHDIGGIAPEGLRYSVFLPVDLSAHRRPCDQGPVTARVRAILSWGAAPPPSNPDFVPTWGNRLETHVEITPGRNVPPGTQMPVLLAVGDVAINEIAPSGLTKATKTIQTNLPLNQSPFDGRITIAGYVANATPGLVYRVQRKPQGAPDSQYMPISNEPAGLLLYVSNGGLPYDKTVHADADGWYPLQDYPGQVVIDQLMAEWYPGAADDGFAFDIRIQLSTDGGLTIAASSQDVATVRIKKTAPTAELSINLAPNVQCTHVAPGGSFDGVFTASDPYFGANSWEVEPSGPPNYPDHGHHPQPAGGTSDRLPGGAVPDPGLANQAYTMDTGLPAPPMDDCGFALILWVSDRTNVNSGHSYHTSKASVGFCVQNPMPG